MAKRRIVLSHSRMQQYLSCPNKYRFSNLYGQRKRDGFSAFAPDVGTALHKAMQHYMTSGGDYQRSVWELGMAYPWPLYDDPYISGDGGRSMPAALAAFDHWCESAPLLNYELVSVNGRPASELTVFIALGSIGDLEFVYELHIDMVCLDKRSDRIIPIDIKTYAVRSDASPTSAYHPLAKYERATQLIGYMLGTRMLLEAAWSGEELDAAYWFLKVDLRAPAFEEREVLKSSEQIGLWLQNICNTCHMIAMQLANDSWLRNESSCKSYGTDCSFAELCWQQQSEVAISDWLTSVNAMTGLAEPEVPDFQFRMEIL